jgi:hypothetical protein
MLKIRIIHFAVAFLCLLPQSVFAAGAYVVDDAGIVDPGLVQIESWYSHSSRHENLGVTDVAYQALPHAELTLLNNYDAQTGVRDDAVSAQVKYQWREDKEGGIESAAVFGVNHSASANRLSGLYAYIPSSLTINDTFDVNADLGWQYDADSGRHFATWGIGAGMHANDTLSFVAETFGKNAELPGAQLGTRVSVSENLVLDAIYGRNITGTPANWVTAGLTVTF